MRILVVSDLHFTNKNFDEARCSYLQNLFNSYDQIILNGDFWCNFSCTFDEFLKSKWSVLFPVLKAKSMIYIQGNHDLIEFCDDRVFLFCREHLKSYTFILKNRRYLVTHGHEYSFDRPKSEKEILFRRKYNIESVPLFLQCLLIKLLTYRIYSKLTSFLVNYSQRKKSQEDKTTTYIMGHTHSFYCSENSNYINTGVINYGVASYIEINDMGPQLHLDTY